MLHFSRVVTEHCNLYWDRNSPGYWIGKKGELMVPVAECRLNGLTSTSIKWILSELKEQKILT